MKKSKLALSLISITLFTGSALAFKPFGSGSVYCNSSCTTRINFRYDPAGTFTDPCDNGEGGEFVMSYSCTGGWQCVEVCNGGHYSSTAAAK